MAKADFLTKGADFIKNIPTAGKIGIGIGGAGLATMGVGTIVGSGSDRKRIKADKLEAKIEAADDASNNLMIAGAIATAGVGGYGIAQAVPKIMSKVK